MSTASALPAPHSSPPTPASDAQHAALGLVEAAVYEWRAASGELIWTDPENAMAVLGQTEHAALARVDDLHAKIPPDAAERRHRFIARPDNTNAQLRQTFPLTTADGQVRWFEERLRWIEPAAGRCIGVLRNIDRDKRRERVLTAVALQDELTGLLPRDRLREAVETAIARTARRAVASAYIAVCLDDLGLLNARFGFDAADQVIAAVGERLGRAAGPGDVVGRTAGNKFGVLLLGCGADAALGAVKHLTRVAAGEVVQTSWGPVAPSLSAGVAITDGAGETSGDLIARAEAALDIARRSGPGGVRIADQSASYRSIRAAQAQTGAEILAALSEDRVELAYQPIVDAVSRAPVRFECLARLRSPDGGVGPAADFITVAEATGLIRPLDVRVLELAGGTRGMRPDVALSVNVSGATVRDNDAGDRYLTILEALGPVAHGLTVELTETCLVEVADRVAEFAARVRATGARFSVDDFGAGYTSFRNLKAIRPDEVKIDGIYANGAAVEDGDISFVQALAHLARALRMEVVAEWVDTEDDAQALHAAGVHRFQGRMFGMAQAQLPPGT